MPGQGQDQSLAFLRWRRIFCGYWPGALSGALLGEGPLSGALSGALLGEGPLSGALSGALFGEGPLSGALLVAFCLLFFTAPLKRAKKKGPKVRLLARRRKKKRPKVRLLARRQKKKGTKSATSDPAPKKCDQKTGSPHPGTNPTPTQPPRQARFQRVEFRICSQSAEALARLVLGVVSSRGVVVMVWW